MGQTWMSLLNINLTKWKIPPDVLPKLETLWETAEDTFNRAQAPNSGPVDTQRNDTAFAELTAHMRDIRRRHFFTPPLTDADIVSLGLRPRDTIRTPHIDVTETVEFELNLRKIREILVNFWVKGQSNRAKPAGYDGAVLVWDVLDTPPERPEDLNRHTMASRTPHTLEFDETERGKTVYIALTWQNERGNIGPWSEIQSAIIP